MIELPEFVTDREFDAPRNLVWTPHEATDSEIACFAGAMEGFGSGWGAGFTIMDDILKELQA